MPGGKGVLPLAKNAELVKLRGSDSSVFDSRKKIKGDVENGSTKKIVLFWNGNYADGSAAGGDRMRGAGAGESKAGSEPDKSFVTGRRKDGFKAFPVEETGEMEQFEKKCGDRFPERCCTGEKKGLGEDYGESGTEQVYMQGDREGEKESGQTE